MERKLAAIVAVDVVGYSRLIRENESGTLAAIKADRENLIEPRVVAHNGRIVKLMGDGLLAEFSSAVEAVQCAVEIQHFFGRDNNDTEPGNSLTYRIGINIGDIVVENDDIYGDGVNLAARLEGLAEPDGICMARNVFNQIKDKLDLTIEHMGEHAVKNIAEPVTAYRVVLDEKAAALCTPVVKASAPTKRGLRLAAVLVAVFALAVGGAVWWQFRVPHSGQVLTIVSPSPALERPSIAVLPFDNMSDNLEQEYLADGMTEDLITDLAKISSLLVIARNSTFAYKGKSIDVREVAAKLNVRYVVEGSVRKSGGRIRINAQLIDAETGTHIWAERYDREVTNLFDLQDEVRARIVTALQVELTPAEKKRLAHHLTDNAEAYDAYLRAMRQESFFTREGNLESIRLYERAIELDPTFAVAVGKLATAYSVAAENSWSRDPEASIEAARFFAEKAVEMDDELPQAHWAVARVYSRKRLFDGDRAIASLQRAIDLDPNYADGYAFLAIILNFVGRSAEALSHIETAMRLNPHFPFWYYYALGANQFMMTQYDAAVASLQKAIERNPTWPSSHRILIAAYGHLGMIEEAEWEMEELRILGFEPTIANFRARVQFQDPVELERYLDGLRKAGMPEE